MRRGGKREEGRTDTQTTCFCSFAELMHCTSKDSGLNILAQIALIVYSAFGIALHYLKIMIHVEEVRKFKQG